MEIRNTTRFLIIYTVIAIVLRIIPHPPNLAAIGALALFAGAYSSKKWALFIPVVAMGISDIIVGLYDWGLMATVYGSFLVIALLGLWVKKHITPARVTTASFVSSIVFFLTTNAAVWAFSPWYAKNFGGLLDSYTLALPFFRNTLAGNLIFTTAFFGVYAYLYKKEARRALQVAVDARASA